MISDIHEQSSSISVITMASDLHEEIVPSIYMLAAVVQFDHDEVYINVAD